MLCVYIYIYFIFFPNEVDKPSHLLLVRPLCQILELIVAGESIRLPTAGLDSTIVRAHLCACTVNSDMTFL